MNKFFLIPTACFAMTLALGSCSNPTESSNSATTKNDEINSFEISQSIKTASCTYKVDGMPDSCHLTLSASITWPENLGNNNIQALQDTILHRTFPTYTGHNVNNAISEFVSQPGALFENDKSLKYTKVQSATENIHSYTADASVSMLEITLDYVTYRIDYSSYLGGAHPSWGADCFTYTFNPARVLTLDNMFTPGYEKILEPILAQAVADETSAKPNELKSMLLTDSVYVSNIVYLYNGMIVFHYNPYALLPYSYGAIDARIAPYEVSDILTPEARTLLLNEQ